MKACIALLGLSGLLGFASPAVGGENTNRVADPVVFSFATVGDSRHDPLLEDLSGQDRRWMQNTRALARIVREIQAEHPQALFFNGDMIMGYSTNQLVLDREYSFWRGMVAGLMETGTYVVPVCGNHEVQLKVTDAAGKAQKVSFVSGEIAWRANMGDLILDTNRWRQLLGRAPLMWDVANTPPTGGPDGITTDQRQLSYSFDHDGIHFVIINTDAVGHESEAPVAWLKGDLERAHQRGARHLFVFGHKMAYTYTYNPAVKPKGLDANPVNQRAFWDLIEAYGATYFCGHEHIYHAEQPGKDAGGKAWQIIVGSGGSPFEALPGESDNPNDRKYAWGIMQVHQSGRVHFQARGFDEKYGATELIEEFNLREATPGTPAGGE